MAQSTRLLTRLLLQFLVAQIGFCPLLSRDHIRFLHGETGLPCQGQEGRELKGLVQLGLQLRPLPRPPAETSS